MHHHGLSINRCSIFSQKVAELESVGKTATSTSTDGSERVPFLTYMLSQDSITTDDALSTAVDLLAAATETVSRNNGVLYTLFDWLRG